MPNLNSKITFIGGGNMSSAMIFGLLAVDYQESLIHVSDPSFDSLDKFRQKNIPTFTDNLEACMFINEPADVIILCVKPQVLNIVVQGLSEFCLLHNPLIISIAAGILVSDISKWLSSSDSTHAPCAIVRCMPNTPALVNQGASALYAYSCSELQKTIAWNIMQSISKVQYWVEKESLLDIVTGISGSGPAYFFLMVECLTNAGVEAGLDYEVAKGLASQTCLGAGQMLINSTETPAELRKKVTSPNGTTDAAIKSMESNGIRTLLRNGINAATEKSAELGIVLGKL